MKATAAVAIEQAALWGRVNFAVGVDAVLERRGAHSAHEAGRRAGAAALARLHGRRIAGRHVLGAKRAAYAASDRIDLPAIALRFGLLSALLRQNRRRQRREQCDRGEERQSAPQHPDAFQRMDPAFGLEQRPSAAFCCGESQGVVSSVHIGRQRPA